MRCICQGNGWKIEAKFYKEYVVTGACTYGPISKQDAVFVIVTFDFFCIIDHVNFL